LTAYLSRDEPDPREAWYTVMWVRRNNTWASFNEPEPIALEIADLLYDYFGPELLAARKAAADEKQREYEEFSA